MTYWNQKDKQFKYISGVRQFFPLAEEQLAIISRIIDKYNPDISNFLDLGCGDGFMEKYIHHKAPDTTGVFLDISPQMIEQAKANNPMESAEFVVQDLAMLLKDF